MQSHDTFISMIVDRVDPQHIEFVDVDPRWIEVGKASAIEEDELPKIASFIQEKKIPADVRLEKAIAHGKIYINKLRVELGLPSLEDEKFKYAVLSPDDYSQVISRLTNGTSDGSSLSANQIDELDTIIFKDVDDPIYIKASFIVHEWVHAFIDRKIHARYAPHTDEGTITESRRIGLAITSIPSHDDTGILLNEMGNYAIQSDFLAYLLQKDQSLNDEVASRNANLAKMNFRQDDPELYNFKGNTDNGDAIKGVIAKKNIHFGNDNDWHTQIYYFVMQLSDDLSTLVDGDNPGFFKKTLTKSKVFPVEQNAIREKVDAVMGRGFYFRLKRAGYDQNDFFPLLREVQEKLYHEKIS